MEANFAQIKDLIFRFIAFILSVKNLVLWIAGIISFLVLLFRWGIKKTTSFVIVVGIILLILTILETLVLNYSIDTQEGLIVIILRVSSYLFMAIAFIYYAFLKP